MRSRFVKVWCPECKTMQFGGECGHRRIELPGLIERMLADSVELHRLPPFTTVLFPTPSGFRTYRVKDGKLTEASPADDTADVNHGVHRADG
jgi:hypothetical protein